MNNDSRKPLVLFIHGFASNADRCWKQMIQLVARDKELENFDCQPYTYRTGIGLKERILFWTRLPDLESLAEELRATLELPTFDNREIILVGHSQGGLVILRYLILMLERRLGYSLARFRQVLLYATPLEGSTFMGGIRKFTFALLGNPQEYLLRAHAREIGRLRQMLRTRILGAEKGTAESFPVPIKAFGGTSDRVVPPVSAAGPFDKTFREIPGTHASLKRPKRHDDVRYETFRQSLLDPVGHPNVFEIRSYVTRIKLEPTEPPVSVAIAGDTIELDTDNKCQLNRSVHFAKNNICERKFRIRYSTLAGGVMVATGYPQGALNEAEPSEQKKYDLTKGQTYTLEFTPDGSDADIDVPLYHLDLTVFNGFGDGNRNAHFHLGSFERFHRELRCVVDLSEYVARGYTFKQVPELRIFPRDDGVCTDECKSGRSGFPSITGDESQVGEGIWSWIFHNNRGGVLDIVFDLDPPGT